MRIRMSIDSTIVTLVRQFASAVAAELKAHVANDNAFFDSRHLPPGVPNRATFARKVKKLDGARLVGKTWVISSSDWYRQHAQKHPVETKTAGRWSPETALAAAGVRRSRGDK